MSALANLKLTAAKRTTQISPVAQRRSKAVKRIHEQIEVAKAELAGQQYRCMRQRSVTDKETGETKLVEMQKRVKPWHWVNEGGKTLVCLFYGSKVVEIAKGKAAIELPSKDDLVATLETLKDAVLGGELDQQLEAVSGAVKAGFKK